MHKLALILGIACLLGTAPAWPQDEDPAAPPPIRPPNPANQDEDVPIPPKVEGEQLEPTVEIRRDEQDSIIEEYSLDGRVYMVKVTPRFGVPYYYLDDDGDGKLEIRESDRAKYPVKPVHWKVKEWD